MVARKGVPGVKEQKTSILCKRLYLLVYNFGRKAHHSRWGKKTSSPVCYSAEAASRTWTPTDVDFVWVRAVLKVEPLLGY